jgi:transcription antitermination factor NusG
MQMQKKDTATAPFRIGQRVRIVSEELYNVPGVVNAIDSGKSQVRVTVNFFGKQTAIKLGYLQVEKV